MTLFTLSVENQHLEDKKIEGLAFIIQDLLASEGLTYLNIKPFEIQTSKSLVFKSFRYLNSRYSDPPLYNEQCEFWTGTHDLSPVF